MIILLHAPQLPENIGAVARVMENFQLSELRLITPITPPTHDKAWATSAGAHTILKNARIFNSLSEAVQDIHHLWGTCADNRLGIRQYHSPRHFMDEEFSKTAPDEKTAILFGCERTGLSQDALSTCKGTLQIPVNPDFSSMNLSHAVGIVCYEYFITKQNTLHTNTLHLGDTTFAPMQEKEVLFKHLIHLLDKGHYWRVPSKKHLMQQNLANLFFRLSLTSQDIRTLFGIVDNLRFPRIERDEEKI